MKELAALKNLTALNLSHCDLVTDMGVKELAQLKNLTYLDLKGCTEVTDASQKELRWLLPNWQIKE